jgi:hypothetical protein
MAWAHGQSNPGCFVGCVPDAYAYATATPLPYGYVPRDGEIVFGIATINANGAIPGYDETFAATFNVGNFGGDMFLNGVALGRVDGAVDLASANFFGPGTYTLVGEVPEPATWAMMLIGFAGLAWIGYHKSKARLHS